VAEVRAAKKARLSELVSLTDLSSALERDKSNVRRAAKKLGIKYALIELDGTGYLTRADATKVAERLA